MRRNLNFLTRLRHVMRYGILRFPSPDNTQKNCGRADGRDGRHFLAEEKRFPQTAVWLSIPTENDSQHPPRNGTMVSNP